MKRIFSLLLAALLLITSLLLLSSCTKKEDDSPVFGATLYSEADHFLIGDAGEKVYKLKYAEYETDEETINALLSGKIDYALLDLEDVDLSELEANEQLKVIPYHPITQNLRKEIVIVTVSGTLFDDCTSVADVEKVFSEQDANVASTEWDLFYSKFITYRGYKDVLNGLKTTMLIAVLGLLIGILIGTVIAVIKVVPKYALLPKILSGICDVYVGFFRGTPMVVQLLIAWFILIPAMNANVENVTVAVVVFGMNSGAYVAEIMRSGIQAVDAGQLEAARALGLGYWISMLKIVIPQAIKNILPTLGNEFIVLVKDTSIVSFIAVVDVTKAFRQIGDANYSYIIPYLMLAAVYLVIVMLITLLIKLLERRLARSERRR
ncbi:MAG: amino acid ABC transporter permease [Clostridia bacterium]|nr:amino acid ABC transporter permease [Clostridia bacterium]